MNDDLKAAISKSRKAIHDQHIPPKTLLGRSIFGALDKAQEALKQGDAEAVRHELDAINRLLAQN